MMYRPPRHSGMMGATESGVKDGCWSINAMCHGRKDPNYPNYPNNHDPPIGVGASITVLFFKVYIYYFI